MSELAGELARLTPPELAQLLRRRPDVLAGAPPRDLTDLALRLTHPHSLMRVFQTLPVPALQVAEATRALGEQTTRAELNHFLHGSAQPGRVDEVVDELVALAVLVGGEDGTIVAPDGLAEIFPAPLGLGPPLRPFLAGSTVDTMRRIAGRLGLGRPTNKTEAVAVLMRHLTDDDYVRQVVGSAPAAIREVLFELAAPPHPPPAGVGDAGDVAWYGDDPDDADDLSEPVGAYLDDSFFDVVSGPRNRAFDPSWYAREQAATRWAADRGLMFSEYYTYGWRMPAEIGRALRGPNYYAPFTPVPPQPVVRPVAADRVETEAGASVTAFADLVLALLDHVVRTPVPALKSGGLGARELSRLSKVLGTGEVPVRLALELADRAGLLDVATGAVRVSGGFDGWRDADPADRLVVLLDAWWAMGATPTQATDDDGRPMRALLRPPDCAGCRAARLAVVETLAELGGATDLGPLAARALWRRPFVHLVDEGRPFEGILREAEQLGVVALGAVSALGQAMLAQDADRLRARAVDLLPPSSDAATFGADLTVFVVGTPSGRVTAVLDAAADREGRGGAVTWRFSPSSIRRALDDGATGDGLLDQLAAVAVAGLPQPLRFLVADVARRHGNLRLTVVACCVRSDDEALLAELASHRKLVRLGLRLLAPTVLASATPHDALLTALRKAGYFPVSEDGRTDDPRADVIELRRGRGPSRSAAAPRAAPTVDLDEVAADLLRAGTAAASGGPLSRTERTLGSLTYALSLPEIRQLAHAIDTASRVAIAYESATGTITYRVIARPELSAGSIVAWCELRHDERVFTVSRIHSVSAV